MRLISISIILLFSQIVYSQVYNLEVTVTNITTLKGVVKVGIYNTDKTFLNEALQYKTQIVQVNEKTEKCTFTNLPKGNYAVSLYQDVNVDGRCNLNSMGFPLEGVGFSNNYKPFLSAPDFEDCKIALQAHKSISISLIYY